MARILIIMFLGLSLSSFAVVKDPSGVSTFPVDIDVPERDFVHHTWNLEYPVSDKEIHCMALNIYFEARGETPDGQFAVADVVMHRVNHADYPNSICEVIKQGVYPAWSKDVPVKNKCHFSWYCDRKPDNPIDSEAFEAAMYVAETVINDPNYIPVLDYAIFYHARNVRPYWVDEEALVADIGNHLFYY